MTRIEQKAIAILREIDPLFFDGWTDEAILELPSCQAIIKGMKWMREECAQSRCVSATRVQEAREIGNEQVEVKS